MEFSRAKQKEEEKALRHFRSKSELFRQRAAITILSGMVTAGATTVILVAVQPDQKIQQQEVVIIQESVGSPRKDEEQKSLSKSEEQKVDIIVTFADESNQYPFAGYEITLQEWDDTPEWDIPQEFKDTGGCMPEAVRVYLFVYALQGKAYQLPIDACTDRSRKWLPVGQQQSGWIM